MICESTAYQSHGLIGIFTLERQTSDHHGIHHHPKTPYVNAGTVPTIIFENLWSLKWKKKNPWWMIWLESFSSEILKSGQKKSSYWREVRNSHPILSLEYQQNLPNFLWNFDKKKDYLQQIQDFHNEYAWYIRGTKQRQSQSQLGQLPDAYFQEDVFSSHFPISNPYVWLVCRANIVEHRRFAWQSP